MLEDYIFQFYEISITQSYKFNLQRQRQLPVNRMMKKRNNPLGAKNNDSHSEKQAIVIFYPLNYRKCGNSN